MNGHYGLIASLVVGLAVTSTTNAAIRNVEVTGGHITGDLVDSVASFKGVPFAAPPVGELRWKAPQPVVPRRGVRDAITFAPACIQPWGEHETTRPSEDCLYLNVWTAARSA
ncbi:MAG TPA: carboxylesterase family protein, partial [Steroidobacteraceae bacterium]|nr:carboxylesterase family protein [Steroidobacteraceae bacterium]